MGATIRLREVYDGRNRVAFRLTVSPGDVGRGELTHAVQCASLIGSLQKRLHLTALVYCTSTLKLLGTLSVAIEFILEGLFDLGFCAPQSIDFPMVPQNYY